MRADISDTFWSDPEVEGLTPLEKLTCFWLIANSSRSLAGITEATPARFTFDTGGVSPDVLTGLCKKFPKFVFSDGNAFLVCNFVRFQFGPPDKLGNSRLLPAIVSAVTRCSNKAVVRKFCDIYPSLAPLVSQKVDFPIHTAKNKGPSKDLPRTTHSPSIDYTRTTQGDSDLENTPPQGDLPDLAGPKVQTGYKQGTNKEEGGLGEIRQERTEWGMPGLDAAVALVTGTGAPYTREQITAAWHELEATIQGGKWIFRGQPCGNALSALMDVCARKAEGLSKTHIAARMELVTRAQNLDKLLESHPGDKKNNPDPSPEQRADWRKKRSELQSIRERLAAGRVNGEKP